MLLRHKVFALGMAGLLVVGATWAVPVYGGSAELYTIQGFVDMLIARGIVPERLSDKARELARAVSAVEEVRDGTQEDVRNADTVSVRVSQLIQNADLTYTAGDNIEGILLLVENMTDTSVSLEAKRKCQTVYRIYAEDDLVYDSATSDTCNTDERVTYNLGAGDTRMFEMKHSQTSYALTPGEYRIELEYPGYGAGKRTVTVE